MSSPEERWWSVRAGEYVLGTLRGEDLELFERILFHDTEMQHEVLRWEQRLAPLNETTRARKPPGHIWAQILERIRNPPVFDSGRSPASGDGERSATVETIRPRRDGGTTKRGAGSPLWPGLAALATAASVLLGLLLYQRTALPPGTVPVSVDGLAVVLADEDGEPYFLVETDYGNLRVRVTALTPPSIDGDRNFQLWQALPDRSSVRPVALLPEESGASQVFDVGSLIEGSDLFGVSIEPEGAPTDDGPTGPVVAHGDFLQKRDVEAEADEADDAEGDDAQQD